MIKNKDKGKECIICKEIMPNYKKGNVCDVCKRKNWIETHYMEYTAKLLHERAGDGYLHIRR